MRSVRINAILLKKGAERKAYDTRPAHRLGDLITLDDLRKHAGGWQYECFGKLRGKVFRSINVPMGGGKSLMACYLAAYELSRGLYKKAIFAVPQDVISAGFAKGKRITVGKKTVQWTAKNLCGDDYQQTIAEVIEFLKREASRVFGDRILVCTHAALVRTYAELSRRRQLHLFDGVHFFIDEAHHIQSAETNGGAQEFQNQLGKFVAYAYKNGLTLMTATPFRGDGTGLLNSEQLSALETFSVSWADHFDTLSIRNLVYDFVLYDGRYDKAIAKLVRQKVITRGNRVIAYIPRTGQAFSLGTKTDDYNCVTEAFWKSWSWLDLVHLDGRGERKQALVADDCLGVNGIVAMNMMREGANWKPADTLVVVGPRHSLTDMVQTMGRLLRDHDGKKTVRVIHMLPFTFERANEDKYRQELNNYLKAVFCSAMVIEDVFCPVKVRLTQRTRNGQMRTVTRTLNAIQQIFPDSAEQENFRVAIKDAIVETDTEAMSKEERREFLLEVVTEELEARGKPIADAKAVTQQLWYQFSRKSIRTGLNSAAIDMELLDRVRNPFKCLLRYTSGKVGGNTFKELRKRAVRGITMDDCHALAAERGGECLGVVEYQLTQHHQEVR